MSSNNPRVFVALGANLDDPAQQVRNAFESLQQLCGVELVARSGLYASSPMGPQNQPDFVNAVCELSCSASIDGIALLDQLQALETASGRQRDEQGVNANGRWGPRALDLDLLLFGQQLINKARLTVPHPGLLERCFVLVPLLAIAPDITVPGKGPARDYVDALPDYDLQLLPD